MRALRRLRGHAADGGASAVEFALVVPVLLLIVFGIIQFGMTFGQILALNNASRQGARTGVVGLNPCSTVMADVYQGSEGAIALQYPLTVTVSRGSTAVCQGVITASGSVSYPSGTANPKDAAGNQFGAAVPCPSGSTDSSITVTSASTGSFTIPPFFFISNYQVTGQGVFQCEIG